MKESIVFWGIGNSIIGDDGAGPRIANELIERNVQWLAIYNCETVPENYVAPLKRLSPETLIIIDTADMGLEPGEYRKMSIEEFSNITFTTHGFPLDLLLKDLNIPKIITIGVQPEYRGPSESLSIPVSNAVKELCNILEQKEWDQILSVHQEKRSPR